MSTTRPAIDALFHYYCEFDAISILQHFHNAKASGSPGFVTNFLGVKVPTSVYPPILNAMDGVVEAPPIPGNWHADIAEWASALRAVTAGVEKIRVVELGCGWGCWLVNLGAAARANGLQVDLIGIEGDKNHLGNAVETLQANGFSEADYRLFHGIAGPREGKAIFPDPAQGSAAWGGEAIFYPDKKTLKRALVDETVQVLWSCFPRRGG